jgi:uncharacterized Zn-finger protein
MRGTPLSDLYPEFAAEADGWDPTTVSYGSEKKLPWKCAFGHQWIASPNKRTSNNSKCPYCSGLLIRPGFDDLVTTNPELAAEADGWDPTTLRPGSEKKVGWKCKLGHCWSASVVSRAKKKQSGCPYCANRVLLSGFNDVATTNPELAAEADGWDPSEVITGGRAKKDWKCSAGHTWAATISNRTHSKTGCPVCTNQRVSVGDNDFATRFPELAAEADGWDPSTVVFGSNLIRRWKCAIGHSWDARTSHRVEGSQCPYCTNTFVLAGFNDLATLFPNIAAQANGWDPTTVLAKTEKRMQWMCLLGHTWKVSAASRTRPPFTGCPTCSNHKLLAGFNDLATTNPDVAAQADGWDPTTVFAGSANKRKWICEQGHKWTTSVATRTSTRKKGCPSCASSGFDPNKDAWLYFLRHELWGLLQIGITNVPDARLGYHKSIGWEILEIRGPMPGDITKQWEQDILRALKHRRVKLSPNQIAQFSGYTEAWIQEDFPAKSLTELMNLVHTDEGK